MDTPQIRAILLFISSFLNLIFTFILRFKGKTRDTINLSWVALLSAIYCFTFGGLFFFKEKLFWIRATWLGVLMTPAYLTFLYHFTGRTKNIRLKNFFWYSLAILISTLALTTPYVIISIPSNYPVEPAEQGFLRPFGRIYLMIGLLVGFYYLLREYFESKEFRKLQIKYFILGFSIYNGIGVLAAGIVPFFFPQFTGIDISAYASVFWVGFTTYAVFKKELFEIKLILTEILAALIETVLLVQIFFAKTLEERIFEFVLFLSFSIIGYLLIKTTYQDIKRKEEAEQLSKKLKELTASLEEKVKERTEEMEKSYTELKERTKELEKRKEELERFHKLTVGRELEMINLKKRIKEVEEELKRLKG